MLTVPPVSSPGEISAHNDANPNLLSTTVTQVSGAKASAFGDKYLLGPMGIMNTRWSDGVDCTEGGDGLDLTTREMARLGLLYLTHGKWDRTQLIPVGWIASTTAAQVPVKDFALGGSPAGWGYLWWTSTLAGYDVAFAVGYGRQYLCLIPDLDTVVVMTGTDSTQVLDRLPIVRDCVIPAVTR